MRTTIHNDSDNDVTGSKWKTLYLAGGLFALITVLLIPIQSYVFIAFPPPTNVEDYFSLLQTDRLIGLLSLDLFYVIDNALLIPILLALYVVCRRGSRSLALIAVAIGLVGIAALFASNTAFNMVYLADGYAAATTEAQRAMFLAAGEAMFANYVGTAYQVSYVLGSLAGVVISVAMLRSGYFGKLAGYAGIFANILGFGLYVPVVGAYISLASVFPFLLVWYIIIVVRLLQLAYGKVRRIEPVMGT